MPTQAGTKISFLRAIFCNKKKALKQANVAQIVVPHYEEISVKNLYYDAMKDELLKTTYLILSKTQTEFQKEISFSEY